MVTNHYRIHVYLNYSCIIQHLSFSPPICRWMEDGSLVDNGSSSFTNWFGSNPNGGVYWNCMKMYSDDGTWGDDECNVTLLYAVCSKPIASAAAATANNITHV